MGITKCGIRLDSGDMAYLTKKRAQNARRRGLAVAAKSPVSNSLDEYIITRSYPCRARRSTLFGVGERLITAQEPNPVFGGVYKLCRRGGDPDGDDRARRSRSAKTSARSRTPHFKKFYRFFDRDERQGRSQTISACTTRRVDDTRAARDLRPGRRWKRKTMHNFRAEELHGARVPARRAGL